MTKQQIILDTLNYYAKDPEGRRATNNLTACYYTTEDGRHCAFGRWMKDKYREDSTGRNRTIDALLNFLDVDNVDDILVKEVQGHSEDFWINLQRLHDTDSFWNQNGITAPGLKHVNNLLDEYTDNDSINHNT